MIKRIQSFRALPDYRLSVIFDDGKNVIYNVKEDMDTIPSYAVLEKVHGLFAQAQLDESRTCIYWNDEIDLASDMIYEYGRVVT